MTNNHFVVTTGFKIITRQTPHDDRQVKEQPFGPFPILAQHS